MITFSNGCRLIQAVSELPDCALSFKNLFCDFETSSLDQQKDSLNPWHTENCQVIGAAITGDDLPYAFFVPREILLSGSARLWFLRMFSNLQKRQSEGSQWINHNVKYDNHVLFNGGGDEELRCQYDGTSVNTVVLGQLLDADRTYKGGYGLDVLSKDWLSQDISHYYHRLHPYLYKTHIIKSGVNKGTAQEKQFNKDYGRIPLDIIADYACAQVMANRDLYHYEIRTLSADCNLVRDTEIKVTSMLIEMERRGLRINPVEVWGRALVSKERQLLACESISKLLGGHEINPNSNNDLYDLFINRFGLPVMGLTDAGNPSFDADAMLLYAAMPLIKPEIKEVIGHVQVFKKESTMCSFFWEPWQSHAVLDAAGDYIIHSDHNQCVRSGRMSAKDPNDQQLNEEAKTCVHPREGYCFLSHDYSQIEYRLILCRIEDARGIKAYNDNPYIDFHQWVADLCEITRKPAKNINFMLGFGGGRKKTVAMLMGLADVVQGMKSRHEIKRRADSIYETYHKNLPGLKKVSKLMELTARRRGFIFNAYGRRLHLPPDRAHIAFNRWVQSTAADVMKERAVAIWQEFKGTDCYLNALVHDEALTEVPNRPESISLYDKRLTQILEDIHPPTGDFAVPIKTNSERSAKSWGECEREENERIVA